jgi:hypothetical protein
MNWCVCVGVCVCVCVSGIVAHGGGDPEDSNLRPPLANSHQDSISTNKKLCVVPHTCHPSYKGWELWSRLAQEINMKSYSKNT